MGRGDAPGRVFGFSLLVALGWLVMVPTAVFVGWTGIPAAPKAEEDCGAVFSCLSRADEFGLGMFLVGWPVLVGATVISAVVAALLARLVRSPFVTGTVSALCGVVGAAAVTAAGYGAL